MFETSKWCLSLLSSQVRPIQVEFRVGCGANRPAISQMVVVFGKSFVSTGFEATGFEHSPNGVVKDARS